MDIVYEEAQGLVSLFTKAGENVTDRFLKQNINDCIEKFSASSYHVKEYGIPYFENGEYEGANEEVSYCTNAASSCKDTDINSKSFLVKDISIINTAGPYAGQAVALRTAGDYIACHRCSIEGYQDTLNAHFGNNQFFFDCHIYGTIDFIFGYAAVVIQNSYIHVRLPREGQKNVITADGRYQEMNNTAIVIHNCSIIPTPELKSKSHVKTYLGRPWKKLSRTIIMESYLDGFIDPQGWIEFDNQSDITALYYAEYHNYGQGSSTSGRVKWPGYHILDNPNDVQSFTVENFIKGSEWLPKLEIPYIPWLVR
ncbi:hypothetical protein JRO89_XS03G0326100 [Xanthoceras sorbifolium]|uniref:Pectinesterase n=1 Tax=Xanthoceras sorbifolium TaxID=99658 RepID=A0ABQ8IEJ0_9ROSI|nr:hypothetical protein JRO89_XS03G0326100 [Xanthoceras sorbifolium]